MLVLTFLWEDCLLFQVKYNLYILYFVLNIKSLHFRKNWMLSTNKGLATLQCKLQNPICSQLLKVNGLAINWLPVNLVYLDGRRVCFLPEQNNMEVMWYYPLITFNNRPAYWGVCPCHLLSRVKSRGHVVMCCHIEFYDSWLYSCSLQRWGT